MTTFQYILISTISSLMAKYLSKYLIKRMPIEWASLSYLIITSFTILSAQAGVLFYGKFTALFYTIDVSGNYVIRMLGIIFLWFAIKYFPQFIKNSTS